MNKIESSTTAGHAEQVSIQQKLVKHSKSVIPRAEDRNKKLFHKQLGFLS
jgi:hypothetical protein